MNILIETEVIELNGCSFGIPWDRAQNYMNFPYPDEVWTVEEIADSPKEDVRGVIVGCDLADYSILANFPKIESLYLYNAQSLEDLGFIRGMIWLQQLYVSHCHVSDITPILQLLEAKKERRKATKDPWERVWLPAKGIYIDTTADIANIDQLIEMDKGIETWLNDKRIREKIKQEHPYRLKEWHFAPSSSCLYGIVFGRPEYSDGHPIHTSRGHVIDQDGKEITFKTRNSIYVVNVDDHVSDFSDLAAMEILEEIVLSDELTDRAYKDLHQTDADWYWKGD